MCCIKQKSLGYKKSYFDIICTHMKFACQPVCLCIQDTTLMLQKIIITCDPDISP